MKCLTFTRTVGLSVIGVIENMSGFVCPCCGEISNIFSTGGGVQLARNEGLTFLGSLPVDTELVSVLDGAAERSSVTKFELLDSYEKTSSARLFTNIVQTILTYFNS